MKDVWVHHNHWCLKALLYYGKQRVHIETGGFEEDDAIKFSGRFRKEGPPSNIGGFILQIGRHY
jgi:hypothetical protein